MNTSSWTSLNGSKEEAIGRGTIFRCQAKPPYEKVVDFMLINFPDAPSGHALIVATGYESGHLLIALPEEAQSQGCRGISVVWLRDNWKKWVYEVGPEMVFYKDRYEVDQNWTPVAESTAVPQS